MNNSLNSAVEMEEILRRETLGFLGMSFGGMPYVVPLTYAYDKGRILFHCALKGKKLDYLRKNPQVCFTVGVQHGPVCPHPQGAKCREDHDSVICYGRARILEDPSERLEALNIFNRCILPDAPDIPSNVSMACYAIEIIIETMTGRRQRKGMERTYWEFTFKA